ncbi:hypothetical protein VTJ04DRAFT_3565 [Mycothermus thermophilus]|uniref:uncharacterized protein n=1 Tax=Humicola insolens TaxID=85995 RepID=UPI00374475EE
MVCGFTLTLDILLERQLVCANFGVGEVLKEVNAREGRWRSGFRFLLIIAKVVFGQRARKIRSVWTQPSLRTQVSGRNAEGVT